MAFAKSLWNLMKLNSTPAMNTIYDSDDKLPVTSSSKSCHQIISNSIFKSNFVVNTMSDYPNFKRFISYPNRLSKLHWIVYRCQLNTQEESCCCSCNSDAMFEVMKSLYDCYKKKNCDNCNCILCGHLPREERRLGEFRKSAVDLGSVAVKEKKKIKKKAALKDLPREERRLAKFRKSAIDLAEKEKKEIESKATIKDKSPTEKKKILKDMAMSGIPLPEAKTKSEKEIINKVRAELGLPPEPKTAADKNKLSDAYKAGLINPLEGKTISQKKKILKMQAEFGVTLPEGRTPSEKALIEKIKSNIASRKQISVESIPLEKRREIPTRIPSEKLQKAKLAGLLTPLEGKTPEEKQRILRGLALQGIPLPEAKSSSEKKIIHKVRAEVGLPQEPKTPSAKENYYKATAAGVITPLQGKSNAQKVKILRDEAKMGFPLPEGRTSSEKSLIARVKETIQQDARVPSEKFRKAKTAGILTPLEGKAPEQRKHILRGLAMHGIPLPEATTASEKNLMDEVRVEVGLPLQPKTPSAKEKYNKAMTAGLITPLEGKSAARKEKILLDQAKMGIQLPVGRTPSEKALIAKVAATVPSEAEIRIQSEKLRKSKAAGLITPPVQAVQVIGRPALAPDKLKKLDKKTAKVVKEKKGLSDECICDLLTPESEREIPAVKAISKIKLQKSKAEGLLLPPLEGKTPEEKKRILKSLAMKAITLPEAKTPSEKKLMDKIRTEIGLPPEPKTASAKEKYNKALAAGLITPLEGKSATRKEDILRRQAKIGLRLPEGRTPSEKALIDQIKTATAAEKKPSLISIPAKKIHKAKAAGVLTPLAGKSDKEKEKILTGLVEAGLPLPEGKTPSEKSLIHKVETKYGISQKYRIPSEKEIIKRAKTEELLTPLQEKTSRQKEKILKELPEARLPMSEGGKPSTKLKAAGALTPLKGKKPEQKEQILRGLAMHGIPFPEVTTASERKIMDKVRDEVGLPLEPKTPSAKEKYNKAMAAGLITPLEGKSAARKEKILKNQARVGISLPKGRTPSEKALIAKVKATIPSEAERIASSEILRRSKAADLLTPAPAKAFKVGRPALAPNKLKKLDRKTAKLLKEKKGPSDECICDLLTPELEREHMEISAFKATSKKKLRKSKADDFLPPLEGKTLEQKKKILKSLAMKSIPLPEPKTASEKKIMDRIRTEIGLPPKPETPAEKEQYSRALAAGFITPLQDKSAARKEDILRGQAKIGVRLPQGRTSFEKALIAKIKASVEPEKKTSLFLSEAPLPSEKIRKAKAAGLLTPLTGKSREKKEKILSGLAEAGLPLPEGKTASEKSLVHKVKTKYGVPLRAKFPSEKEIKKSKKFGVASLRKSIKGVRVSKSKGGIISEYQDIIKTTTCDRGCGCDKKKIRFKHSYIKIRVTSPDISSLCPCPEECVPGVKGGVFTDNEGIKVTIGTVIGVPSYLSRDLPKSKTKLTTCDTYTDSICYTTSSKTVSSCKIDSRSSRHRYISKTISKEAANAIYCLSDISPLKTRDNFIDEFQEDNTIISIKSFTKHQNKQLLYKEIEEESYSSETQLISLESIYLLKTWSSISSVTASDTCSVTSFPLTEASSYSNNYSQIDVLYMDCDGTFKTNKTYNSIFYSISDFVTDDCSTTDTGSYMNLTKSGTKFNNRILILNAVHSESNQLKYVRSYSHKESATIVKNWRNVDCKKLKKRLNDSSSLIIIMPSSSDECDINYSLSNLGSTIYLQFSESYSNRTHTTNSPRKAFQRNIGRKGVIRNKHLEKDITITKVDSYDKNVNGNLVNGKQNKHCQAGPTSEKEYRISSIDTTQDRPCCCLPKEDSNLQRVLIQQQRVENIVSESVTPMIQKETLAQGLSHEAYKNLKNKYSVHQSHASLFHRNRYSPTPVRLCKVPPCSGHTGCHHRPAQSPMDCPIDVDLPNRSMKSYSRSPDRIMETIEKSTKMITIACGNSKEDLNEKPNLNTRILVNTRIPCKSTNSASASCISCKPPEWSDETLDCLYRRNTKKVKRKKLCPCGQYTKPPQREPVDNPSPDKIGPFSDNDFGCHCKGKPRSKKNKNIICECPEEPELKFDIEDWIDETKIRKMKSDLTQTISGFKLNMPKRLPEPDSTFEEILKFYAESLEQYKGIKNVCSCNKNAQKKTSANCECPYEPPPPVEELTPLEPFKGIKFHIGGKGSESKGLSGILCFELFQEVLSDIK